MDFSGSDFTTGNFFAMVKTMVATAILGWAVFEDLRTRKFSNRTFLIATAIGLILEIASGGFREIIPASLGFASGVVLFLPLVSLGIVGAGDMKLMAAFGVLAGWNAVLWTSAYGIVWGAIFGVFQVLAKRQGKLLLTNLTTLTLLRTKSGVELHRIPFTVPLLLGWLTFCVLSGIDIGSAIDFGGAQ